MKHTTIGPNVITTDANLIIFILRLGDSTRDYANIHTYLEHNETKKNKMLILRYMR